MTTAEKVRDRLSVGGLDACWEWKGAVTGSGYGTTTEQGRTILVHRFMWERFHGPIPQGKQIDHRCRNRKCGNPRHMELVTSAENTLRGTGPTALNAQKTHCKNGHEFTPENTYQSKKGRECLTCKKELARRWHRSRALAHEEECDGSADCKATVHIHGCFRSVAHEEETSGT